MLAQSEDYSTYSNLNIDYNFNANISLSGSSNLDEAGATLFFYPLESLRQERIFLQVTSDPDSEIIQNGNISFIWNQYSPILKMNLDSEIKTKNKLYKINPTPFPIINLEQEYEKYLEPKDKIDITEEIVDQATEIIQGQTDLYIAVFKLAEWTKTNIKYDLNLITSEDVLKSSWVLENKKGVCDEITSLFISFLRSVGIPARFVSGLAYTNSSFNNHAWAEVYFPDYGWVPYDVTFGEYGWINPAHIELSKSLDSSNPAISYFGPSNINMELSPISSSAKIISQGEEIGQVFDIKIEPLKDKVGPGSYVPFKVTIENPFDKYITDTIIISKSQPLLEDNMRPILLKPKQKKSSFWITKIPEDINQGYIYTTIIEAKDIFGSIDSDTIQFSFNYDVFEEQEALDLISELEEQEEKTYSNKLSLNCNSSKPYYYLFETAKINCQAQNIGNTLIRNLNVCLSNDCENIDLNIAEKKQIEFNQKTNKTKLIISAKNELIDIYSFVDILILEEPDLFISDLKFPSIVNYKDEFNITFTLNSEAKIEDIKIKLNNLKKINIEKEEKTMSIIIKTKGKHFLLDELKLKIDYKDEYGNKFNLENLQEIKVINLPWYAKIIKYFGKLIK